MVTHILKLTAKLKKRKEKKRSPDNIEISVEIDFVFCYKYKMFGCKIFNALYIENAKQPKFLPEFYCQNDVTLLLTFRRISGAFPLRDIQPSP